MNPWDINWLMVAVWIAITMIGVISRDLRYKVAGNLSGIILGIMLLSENEIIALFIVFLNLAMLFVEVTGETGRRHR